MQISIEKLKQNFIYKDIITLIIILLLLTPPVILLAGFVYLMKHFFIRKSDTDPYIPKSKEEKEKNINLTTILLSVGGSLTLLEVIVILYMWYLKF